jgi:hypothetical protein
VRSFTSRRMVEFALASLSALRRRRALRCSSGRGGLRNVDCSVQKSERHVFEMGGKPTANNMHSSALVMRDEWPWPVVSSTTSTLPIGNFRAAPSVVKTSYSPRTVIKTIRRGAGCGSPPFQLGGAPIQKVGPSEIRNGAVCKGSAGGTANPEISSTLKSSKHGFPLASAKSLA